jgi:polyisoprenoid-binding protein YceI
MRTLKSLLTLGFVAMVMATAGCGGSPSEPASKATMVEVQDTAPAPAEPSAPAGAAEAAAPAEAAATETPAAETPPPPATPAADAKTYTIIADENHYDCIIAFTGYKPLGSREGGFSKFSGTVTVPGGNLEDLHVDLNIDMESLFTDADALTGVLRGETFFHVDQFKTARFSSSKVEKSGEDYLVTGNLEMRGVTKGIQFPAKIAETPKGLTVKAQFQIDRTQWGISTEGWQDTVIKNEVLLNLDILATPEAA